MTCRYQSMDVLRAIAILTVILAHAVLSYGAPENLAPLQLGGIGVDLFFVLSGWLLGGQLFKELENTNHINITRFWSRRWLRTLPAYYIVLLANSSQRWFNEQESVLPFEYLVFIQNYDYPLEFFTISWSLCVEEQFYLVIAPLILLLSRLNRRSTKTMVLVGLLLLPALFRFLGEFGSPEETHVRLDGCILGVLLACIKYQHGRLWVWLIKVSPILALAALSIYLFSFYERWNPMPGWEDPGKLMLSLMFGCWVILANSHYEFITKLYIPGARYIAERAYALYLLHPEALALMKHFFLDISFGFYFALTLGISLFLAEILFRCVEKPFMDMREKNNFTR